MYYHVKLSENAISQIREKVGIESGQLNLKTGVITVNSPKKIEDIAKLYGINNVNNKPYESSETLTMLQQVGEEKRSLIGKKVEIGSIVRIRKDDEIHHIVIVSIDGMFFEGARILLTAENYDQVNEVLIKKGEDVIYRNSTYKDKVRVLTEHFFEFKEEDFIRGSGGKIVGRIINEDTIQKIINLAKDLKTPEEPEKAENVATEVCFEEIIENTKGYNELVETLNLPEGLLKKAVCISIENGHSNMKKLLPILQKEYSGEKLSQNAIKNLLMQEFRTWCEKQKIAMKESSVSYFLKLIVKKFKSF